MTVTVEDPQTGKVSTEQVVANNFIEEGSFVNFYGDHLRSHKVAAFQSRYVVKVTTT